MDCELVGLAFSQVALELSGTTLEKLKRNRRDNGKETMKAAMCGVALATYFAGETQGQVMLNESDFAYKQNFDTLAPSGTANSWIDSTTLVGWYAEGGTSGPLTTYNAGTGTSTTGSLYSFGSVGAPADRALGSLASDSTGSLAYGVRLRNATASSLINNFSISYAGEQWRDNLNANAQSLQFSYRVSNSPITSADALHPPGSGGWIAIPANPLDFVSPMHTGASSALDGNLSANRMEFMSTSLTGVVLNPGDELFIRWFDANDSGTDHALAIDDLSVAFTVSAVPEPREYAAVAALGLLGFAVWRRTALKRV